MDPTPEALAAANSTRIAFGESPVWVPALRDTVMRPPSPSVVPLQPGDIHYFVFEFSREGSVTARFAISADGALLEAEGVKQTWHRFTPFIDRAELEWWASGKALRQVWMPCNETTRRLRPLWEVSQLGVKRYVRVDGVLFEKLTTNVGLG